MFWIDWLFDVIAYACSGGTYLKKAEERRVAELGPMARLAAERDPVLGQVRYVRRLTRWMAGIGLLLVWIVGAGVKVIMDSLGKATRPWSDFTGRSLRDLPSILTDIAGPTMLAGAPFLLIAFVGKRYLGERVAAGIDAVAFGRFANVVLCGYVGAVLTAIYLYGSAWWFPDVGLMVILFPPAIALGAGFGYFAGLLIFDPERNSREKGPDISSWYPP